MEKRTKLFWSPCAVHCLDQVLENIRELSIFYNTLVNAKKITTYIYRHTWVLNLYRQYSKGRKLACDKQQKNALRSMFASKEWATSSHASKSEAKQVMNLVLSDGRFWKSITYCLKCVIPLVKVLRLVDSDSKPVMSYIMDKAKEQIAENFQKQESRWNLQLHRPLHAAAYYLNPRYHYDKNFNPDSE
ncbi:hypothetical protein CR513_46589, partial [Mucuna pruriens]